jgi:hypothetical protein
MLGGKASKNAISDGLETSNFQNIFLDTIGTAAPHRRRKI